MRSKQDVEYHSKTTKRTIFQADRVQLYYPVAFVSLSSKSCLAFFAIGKEFAKLFI